MHLGGLAAIPDHATARLCAGITGTKKLTLKKRSSVSFKRIHARQGWQPKTNLHLPEGNDLVPHAPREFEDGRESSALSECISTELEALVLAPEPEVAGALAIATPSFADR